MGEHIFDKRCDHRAECSAHDDADRHIENVATQNKITKSLQHVFLLKLIAHIVPDRP